MMTEFLIFVCLIDIAAIIFLFFKIRREERMKTSRLKKPMILIMSTLKIEEKNTR